MIAREAIDSGAAKKVLDAYVEITNSVAQPLAASMTSGGTSSFSTAGGVAVMRSETVVDGTAEVCVFVCFFVCLFCWGVEGVVG